MLFRVLIMYSDILFRQRNWKGFNNIIVYSKSELDDDLSDIPNVILPAKILVSGTQTLPPYWCSCALQTTKVRGHFLRIVHLSAFNKRHNYSTMKFLY